MAVNQFKITWFFIIVVLITGLFFPYIMGSDAPEYASIATQMHYRNDWVNIINHNPQTGEVYDYLDKPHLLFWSAMAGFKLFGVHDWSYRLVSVLLSIAATFATFRLGKLLYNEAVGKIAAIIFITAQAILLANHDVKTDTLLTSFVALAVWHFAEFVQRNRLMNMIWGSMFLAGGVGTKGMIAVLVTGCVIFFFILGQKKWKALFNPKWIIGVLAFFIALSPVLYAYYLQFDAHPEKFINGSYGQSGIKFILWTQSFERFAGDRTFVMNPQFDFFFHSFLWAFLPWSFITYAGVFFRIKEFFKTRFGSFFIREQLTFTGVWVMFIIMSLSKFKLPHYLNILFPMMAVFTAGFLFQLWQEKKHTWLKIIQKIQWGLIVVLMVLLVVINAWAFPVSNWLIIAVFVGWFLFLLSIIKNNTPNKIISIWYPSAIAILLTNFILNTNFYPKLNQYQGGSSIAIKVHESDIDWNNVYNYGLIHRPFDYFSRRWRPLLSKEKILEKRNRGEEVYLYTVDHHKQILNETIPTETIFSAPDYHISKLTLKFINPKKRAEQHHNVYLLRVK